MNPHEQPFLPERQALIDLQAVRENVRQLLGVASPAKLMAVVKADGYGHGMVPVARAALQAGAAWLGVAHISEALQLREAGIEAPILAWLHTPSSDFSAALAAGIDVAASGWELDYIVAAAREQQRPARVHLKIDTGLGRNGSTAALWDSLVGEAMEHQDQGLLRVVGIFSHLAVADEPRRPETDEQLERFREAVAVAEDAGADLEVRHLANTPALLSRPDTHFDLVRAGIGIYGLSPFSGTSSLELGLKPAMTLRTRVAQCKDVPRRPGRFVRIQLPHARCQHPGPGPAGLRGRGAAGGHRWPGPDQRQDLPRGGPHRDGPDGGGPGPGRVGDRRHIGAGCGGGSVRQGRRRRADGGRLGGRRRNHQL